MTGSGEPVVLIHGNFGDLRYWDGQVASLSEKFRVIRYDVSGFGRSSLPAENVPYAHHSDLSSMLEALGVSRAHVVGFSMGSGIAIDFVLEYPEVSSSLVSVGPWVSGHSSDATQMVLQDFAGMRDAMQAQGPANLTDYALTQTFLAETIR